MTHNLRWEVRVIVYRISDRQARMLMVEKRKSGSTTQAALKAGVHRNTATKYLGAGKVPSEMVKARTWRTRTDPFAEVWEAEIEPWLVDTPEIEAKTLLDYLVSTGEPGRYDPGQLRSLQRRFREWRALNGPEKEVMFPQQHRPGE